MEALEASTDRRGQWHYFGLLVELLDLVVLDIISSFLFC
jgi:hypothetical protein